MEKQRLLELAGMQLNEDTTTELYKQAIEALALYVAQENSNNYKELSDEERKETPFNEYGVTDETVVEYVQHMADDVADRLRAIQK
jgi:hypothetical protein